MENKIYRISYTFIILCFSSIFLISLFKIVNGWSFSQAQLSYVAGFVKRGFFGSVMIFFNDYFEIPKKQFFSIFFIILTSLNIYLFFKIIKILKYQWILLIYFVFNPALLLFPFNDIGGYQRFDSISVFLILFHVFIVQKIYNNEITVLKYKTYLILLTILIFFSILIHEIQIFSIPFHLIVSYHLLKNKYEKFLTIIFFLSLITFGIMITLFFNADSNMIDIITKKNDLIIYLGALKYAAGTGTGFAGYLYEFKTNLLNDYNLRIHLFFLLLTLIPIFSVIYFFNLKKVISKPLISNHYFYVISIIPFVCMFFIGDVGRWISLMAFVCFGLLMTNNIKINEIKKQIEVNFFTKIILLILIIFYCMFTRIPHCCDLSKKGISIFGGLTTKFTVFGHLIMNSKGDYFDLNKRFPL